MGYFNAMNGEYDKALTYYKKSEEGLLSFWGEKHSDIATIYDNIGSTYRMMKDYKKAYEKLFKALEISLEIHDNNHILTADILFDLG